MYLSSIRNGFEGLQKAESLGEKNGEEGVEAVKELVESNRDAVGIWLDKQVSAPSKYRSECCLLMDSDGGRELSSEQL